MATKEQIWAAAEELAAEGRNPTLVAVRERLGGGSYTDICAAMQPWKANRRASAAPIREQAPASIAERLAEFGAEVWANALELADGRLQAEREALDQARTEAERTRREAADLADWLAADLDKAQAEIERQAQRLATGEADIERLYDALRTQTEATTAAVHRADVAETSRTELQERVKQLADLLRDERAARQEAEADAYKVRADVARLTAELAASERRAADIEAHASKAEQTCLENAAREIERLRKDKTEAEERAGKAEREAAELRGRLIERQLVGTVQPS